MIFATYTIKNYATRKVLPWIGSGISHNFAYSVFWGDVIPHGGGRGEATGNQTFRPRPVRPGVVGYQRDIRGISAIRRPARSGTVEHFDTAQHEFPNEDQTSCFRDPQTPPAIVIHPFRAIDQWTAPKATLPRSSSTWSCARTRPWHGKIEVHRVAVRPHALDAGR